eukprot:403331355
MRKTQILSLSIVGLIILASDSKHQAQCEQIAVKPSQIFEALKSPGLTGKQVKSKEQLTENLELNKGLYQQETIKNAQQKDQQVARPSRVRTSLNGKKDKAPPIELMKSESKLLTSFQYGSNYSYPYSYYQYGQYNNYQYGSNYNYPYSYDYQYSGYNYNPYNYNQYQYGQYNNYQYGSNYNYPYSYDYQYSGYNYNPYNYNQYQYGQYNNYQYGSNYNYPYSLSRNTGSNQTNTIENKTTLKSGLINKYMKSMRQDAKKAQQSEQE